MLDSFRVTVLEVWGSLGGPGGLDDKVIVMVAIYMSCTDIQTFLESETDGREHDGGDPKTRGGGCRNVHRSDPLHHKPASDALKCATALYGFI